MDLITDPTNIILPYAFQNLALKYVFLFPPFTFYLSLNHPPTALPHKCKELTFVPKLSFGIHTLK